MFTADIETIIGQAVLFKPEKPVSTKLITTDIIEITIYFETLRPKYVSPFQGYPLKLACRAAQFCQI